MCNRNRAIIFPIDEINCHEKKLIPYNIPHCNITLKTLNKYVPRKTKHARGNQMPSMTKDLSKIL